jgi:hypothetical protein
MALQATFRHESSKYTVILSERSESKDLRLRLLYVTFNGAGAFRLLENRQICTAFRPGTSQISRIESIDNCRTKVLRLRKRLPFSTPA